MRLTLIRPHQYTDGSDRGQFEDAQCWAVYAGTPIVVSLPFGFVTVIIHGSSHYNDVIMGAITSLITSLTIVYSTVYSDADQRKLKSSASLAFVWGIHRGPVNSPHKWPVTRKMLPFDDVIMLLWIFPWAPLIFNGAPRNIQGNITGVWILQRYVERCSSTMQMTQLLGYQVMVPLEKRRPRHFIS